MKAESPLGLSKGYLMSVLATYQLYRGSQIYLWGKSEYPEKTTDLSQVYNKL
jgi:hypothetical protein